MATIQEPRQRKTSKKPSPYPRTKRFAKDKEITILRLITLHNKRYYIFIDTPNGEMLRETGIIIRKDKKGTRYLEEEDVKSYLKDQFEGEKIEFF